jgi:hypothetical protein
METRCQKCGTPAASDQAFCGKCGAVLGMVDAAGGGASPELAATMVGKKLPTAPPAPRPESKPPAAHRPSAPPTPTPKGGPDPLILVAVGFVVVLLVGTLVLLFFLLGRG